MDIAHNPEIIILGAGVAGLTAARVLSEAGRRVLVLEARDRVGGRILTLRDARTDCPLEMGAEFVHGQPPELWRLLDEARLTPKEREGQQICQKDGKLGDCPEHGAWELLDRMKPRPDLAFTDWLARQDVSPEIAQRLTGFIEGFNAADANRIGTAALAKQQKAEDEIDGSRSFHLREGYDRVPQFLREKCKAAGAIIQLCTEVKFIRWNPGRVEVRASLRDNALTEDSVQANPALASGIENREVLFTSAACIITLPLGVLQTRKVVIDPMPSQAQQAIGQLAMGAARRLVCVFDEPFWAARFPRMSFLFLDGDPADPGFLRTWWTDCRGKNPAGTAAVLVGWQGGPRAATPIPDHGAFTRRAIASLAKAFGIAPDVLWPKLRSRHLYDWQSDPYSLGAYSYAPQGALHASDVLAQSYDHTLYFAGEHTDTTGHWGTVHGAMRSGLRAAEQVLHRR